MYTNNDNNNNNPIILLIETSFIFKINVLTQIKKSDEKRKYKIKKMRDQELQYQTNVLQQTKQKQNNLLWF